MTNTINPGAFNYGTNESYWARVTTPEYQAERAARKAQEELEAQRLEEALQQQEQRYQVMTQAGPAVIDLIRQYHAQNRPALTHEVRKLFMERLPGMTEYEFQQTLDVLTQNGDVIEKVTTTGISGYGTEGFMGAKVTDLHVVADLG